MQYRTAKTPMPVLNGKNETRYQKNMTGNKANKSSGDSAENKSNVKGLFGLEQNRFYYDDPENIEWEYMQTHE